MGIMWWSLVKCVKSHAVIALRRYILKIMFFFLFTTYDLLWFIRLVYESATEEKTTHNNIRRQNFVWASIRWVSLSLFHRACKCVCVHACVRAHYTFKLTLMCIEMQVFIVCYLVWQTIFLSFSLIFLPMLIVYFYFKLILTAFSLCICLANRYIHFIRICILLWLSRAHAMYAHEQISVRSCAWCVVCVNMCIYVCACVCVCVCVHIHIWLCLCDGIDDKVNVVHFYM